MKKKTQAYFEAYDYFRTNLKKNETIYCIIKHVSQSGMTRHISFFCIVDNQPKFLDGSISKYLDYRMNKYYNALVVGGCGMDMAFSVVNHLQEKMSHDKNCYYTHYHFIHRII